MSQEQQAPYPQQHNPLSQSDQAGSFTDTSELYTDWKGQIYTTEEYKTRYQTDWESGQPLGHTTIDTERSHYLSGPTLLTGRSTFPEADLPKLVQLFLHSTALDIRLAALRNMGRFGPAVQPQVLFTGLCDSLPQIRATTLETIASLASYQPIPIAVLATFLYDTHPLVRTQTAWCLGHFRDAIPVQALMEVIEEDEDVSVRAAALLALSKSPAATLPAVTSLLLDALRDSEWQMREAAIQALSSNEETLPFNKLSNFVLYDDNELVRIAAMQALAGRDSNIPSAIKILRRLKDEENLQAFDTDSQQLLRSSAGAAIEGITQRLLSIVQSSQSSKEQQWAALRTLDALDQLHFVDIGILRSFISYENAWPDIRERAASALQEISKGIPISKAGIKFLGLTPQHSIPAPLLTFALDASYNILLIQYIAGTARHSSEQLRLYIQTQIRSEYIRALLNSRTAIVPHESFYESPVLSRDFLHEGESYNAFLTLLRTWAIVPYLHQAQQPDQEPQHEPPPDAFAVWQQVCTSVLMQCLRLHWNKPAVQDEQEFADFYAQLCKCLAMINVEQAQRILIAAGIPATLEQALGQQLHALRRRASELQHQFIHQDVRQEMQRSLLAEDNATPQSIQTEGISSSPAIPTTSRAILDNTLKQFVDLAYYKLLAQKLHSPLSLPRGAMPLSALQEDRTNHAEGHPKLIDTLVELAGKPSPFTLFEAGMYVESLSMLSLADVLTIRKSEEWESYVERLHKLLTSDTFILERDMPRLHRSYVRLMQSVTLHLLNRLPQEQARNVRAYWQAIPSFEIEIGGARASILWEVREKRQEVLCRLSGREQPHLSASKSAPYSIAFSIGQSSIQRSTADLSQTFILSQGWLMHAKGEWLALLAQLKDKVQQRVYRQEGVSSAPTLYTRNALS
jgi:HEAT repeat protein